MRYLLIFLFFGVSGCSLNDSLLIASSGLLIADWKQTLVIAKNPDMYYEKNVIIGKHPSEDKVNLYFGTCLLGNVLLPKLLTDKQQTYWYVGLIILESVVIRQNLQLGLNFL